MCCNVLIRYIITSYIRWFDKLHEQIKTELKFCVSAIMPSKLQSGWVPRRWCSPDFSRSWDFEGLRGMAVLFSLVGCLLCQPQIRWFSFCSVSFLTAPNTLMLQCLNFTARFKWHKPSCSIVHIHDVLMMMCEKQDSHRVKILQWLNAVPVTDFIFSYFHFKNFNFTISNYELHMTVWSINYGQILHSAYRFIILVSLYCTVVYKLTENNIKIWHITVLVIYNQEQSILEVSLWNGHG